MQSVFPKKSGLGVYKSPGKASFSNVSTLRGIFEISAIAVSVKTSASSEPKAEPRPEVGIRTRTAGSRIEKIFTDAGANRGELIKTLEVNWTHPRINKPYEILIECANCLFPGMN